MSNKSMSNKPLEGKVALVTGAASPIGIGRHVTMAMIEAGARVALLDRNGEWLEKTVAEARALGGQDCALPILADITDPEAAAQAVNTAATHFGGLHVLFNNAGTSPTAEGLMPDVRGRETRFWEITPEAWSRVVAVNFSGAFFMSRAAAPLLLAQGWGRIISVTTSMDTMYRKGNAPYGPSKAGHEALLATMAQELEGSGVTANVLTPGGGTNTNLIPRSVPDTYRNALIKPEVMRAPAVWLASNASDGFNGQRIIAARWDETLPITERLARAAAPAAWPQLGAQSVRPS
jgi:NAD(P)-dependent dehydrogenase (short-subunit alcohol dehydrogenase family)